MQLIVTTASKEVFSALKTQVGQTSGMVVLAESAQRLSLSLEVPSHLDVCFLEKLDVQVRQETLYAPEGSSAV
jgi:hypothetical protein